MNGHNRGDIILDHLGLLDEEVINCTNNASNNNNNNYKNCPRYGQGLIPFRYGLCFCGNQIGLTKFLISTDKSYI